jgi:hypothetical protein
MKHERYCPIAGDDTLCPPLCRQMEVLRAARETKELLIDIRRLAMEAQAVLLAACSFGSDAEIGRARIDALEKRLNALSTYECGEVSIEWIAQQVAKLAAIAESKSS